MRKRFVALLSMCCVSLAGCGTAGNAANTYTPPADSKESQAPEEQDHKEAPEATSDTTKEESALPMVAVVTYQGGIEDGAFNQSAWEGLQRLSGMAECDTNFYESASVEDFDKNMEKAISGGVDLCWGIGYGSSEAMREEARKHPETSFGMIDYAYEEMPENMTGVVFRTEEASFVAGYIAANVSESGKIGFVGGESNEVIDTFRYGYSSGAAYGAKKLGKEIEVVEEFTGSFTDSAAGKALATKMYADGCDVIFHAAGESGLGVIEAAKEAGKFVIGVDKDQSFLAPENVLTSVIKYVNNAVYQVSLDFLNGDHPFGSLTSLGLAENAVGIGEVHNLYSAELYEEAMDLQKQIAEGVIIPPATEEEYQAFISQ